MKRGKPVPAKPSPAQHRDTLAGLGAYFPEKLNCLVMSWGCWGKNKGIPHLELLTPSVSAHTTLPHRQDIRGPSLRNCVSKKRELKILITGKIIYPNAEFSISSLVLYS